MSCFKQQGSISIHVCRPLTTIASDSFSTCKAALQRAGQGRAAVAISSRKASMDLSAGTPVALKYEGQCPGYHNTLPCKTRAALTLSKVIKPWDCRDILTQNPRDGPG